MKLIPYCGCMEAVIRCCVLLAGIIPVSSVRINRLHVPEIIKQGSSTILDCDYSLEGPKDDGLVVKWFFNDRLYPVYQWIPNARPQELGILKGRLNLDFVASTDSNSEHRALLIDRVGAELSGNYTCLVSTFSSEDRQTKSMLVFTPGKMNLRIVTSQNEELTHKIVCYVDAVFPKPLLRIYMDDSEIQNTTTTAKERQDSLFDIAVEGNIPELVDGKEFICELYIPQANYTIRKEVVYYKDQSSSGIFQSIISAAPNVLCFFFVWYFYGT